MTAHDHEREEWRDALDAESPLVKHADPRDLADTEPNVAPTWHDEGLVARVVELQRRSN